MYLITSIQIFKKNNVELAAIFRIFRKAAEFEKMKRKKKYTVDEMYLFLIYFDLNNFICIAKHSYQKKSLPKHT